MADAVRDKIVAQGDKVRELKANKAAKDAVQAEVGVLLALKAEYKGLTGEDYKPPGAAPKKQQKQQPALQTVAYAGRGFSEDEKKALSEAAADDLDGRVASCGEYIRKLKAEKASKEKVGEEVKVLLFLKGLYKERTGADWKPPAAADNKTKDEKKSKQPETKKLADG